MIAEAELALTQSERSRFEAEQGRTEAEQALTQSERSRVEAEQGRTVAELAVVNMARELLKSGCEVERVAQLTGWSVERVKSIQNSKL